MVWFILSTMIDAKLDKLCTDLVIDTSSIELAHGFLRYEALRKLNASQFKMLCRRNLKGEWFDGMVDQLVLGNMAPIEPLR